MKYDEFVYLGILVRLMKVKNYLGWYAEVKDQKYGNYYEIEVKDEKDENSVFDVLKDNAKETINQLLK